MTSDIKAKVATIYALYGCPIVLAFSEHWEILADPSIWEGIGKLFS